MKRSKDARDDGDIRRLKCFDERLLENPPSAGLRARFEHRPNPRLRVALPYRRQCFFHRGRVMRKIIVNAYSFQFAADLKASLHTLECRQSTLNHVIRNAEFSRDNHNAEGVLHIESTRKRNREVSNERIGPNYIKRHALATWLSFHRLPLADADARSSHTRKCGGDDFSNHGAVYASDDQSRFRHDIDQSAEGGLDRLEICIDVGMIE